MPITFHEYYEDDSEFSGYDYELVDRNLDLEAMVQELKKELETEEDEELEV